MIFKDKTAFTSGAYDMPTSGQVSADAYITVTGPGPVYIEQLEEDGVWRSFPESTFSGPTAQLVSIKRGRFRVRIDASAATTVEIVA